MACNNYNNQPKCGCEFNVKTVGVCDVSKINFNGSQRETLNWTEVSVPEMLCVPDLKPDIEHIDQVYANLVLNNTRLIETPFAYRSYLLESFYTAVVALRTNAALGTEAAPIPTIVTQIDDLLQRVSGTDTPPSAGTLLGDLQAAINAVNSIVSPAVPTAADTALLNYATTALPAVNSANSGVTTALNAVRSAALDLITAINVNPIQSQPVCAAITALLNALPALATAATNLQTVINTERTAFEALSTTEADYTAAVWIEQQALNSLFTGGLSAATFDPLVATVATNNAALVTALNTVDCTRAQIFQLISNAEGTCLSGRKLIVEGTIRQKVVYTAEVAEQSVHSAHYEVPFVAFIIPYANFEDVNYETGVSAITGYDATTGAGTPSNINGFVAGADLTSITPNLCEEFVVDSCIEDIFIYALDSRTMFKNVTLFLRARLANICS